MPQHDPDTQLLFATDVNVDWPIIRLVGTYASGQFPIILIGGIAAIVSPLASLLPIYLIESVIDGVLLGHRSFSLPFVPTPWLPHHPVEQLMLVVSIMLLLAGVGAVTAWIGALAWGRLAQNIQHSVRTDSFQRVQNHRMAFFDREQSGQLVSILTGDVDQLNHFLERGIAQTIEILGRFVAIVGLLLLLHWQLALIVCVVIPMIAVVARYFVRQLAPKHQAVRQRIGVLHARVQNTLTNIPAVKAFTQESREVERIRTSSRTVYDRRMDVIRIRARFFPALTIVNWLGFSALLVIGGYWILVGPPPGVTRSLHVGTLVTFMLFSQHLTEPLVQGAQLVDNYYDTRASARRILALRERGQGVENSTQSRTVEQIDGRISVDNITFGYETNEPILRDISFEVSAGTFVGIVGATGSGKTTIAKLLLRLYDPGRGRILIDGSDIRTVELSAYRAQIGMVFQQPRLFTGTFYENIVYGQPTASQADIERAARIAQVHDLITSLPREYDTPVGEGGARLSSGQRQRIAIARAVVTDPPVLLLDEATSHVDAETAAHIRDALHEAFADRTRIAIAHRLATVRRADKIIVLEKGEIVEIGTHNELLGAEGPYARLWSLQQGRPHSTLAPHS